MVGGVYPPYTLSGPTTKKKHFLCVSSLEDFALSKAKWDGKVFLDGRKEGRTDRLTDERTDGRTPNDSDV